jgi:Rap1a immunity proteins
VGSLWRRRIRLARPTGTLRVIAIAFVAALSPAAVRADPQNATAQNLLRNWKDGDPSTTAFAEVIASAFASGLAAAGRLGGICPPSDLGGKQIMRGLERFVDDNPAFADKPYGVAMAASLRQAFPCRGL